jgi:class 3 adenylate cyclase
VIRRWHAFGVHAEKTILPSCNGRLVKNMGDGLLVEFRTAPEAVRAATEMHG